MVRAYLKASGYTQARLCKEINTSCGYRVNPGEMSLALSGALETPKAIQMLTDSVSILKRVVKEQTEQVGK